MDPLLRSKMDAIPAPKAPDFWPAQCDREFEAASMLVEACVIDERIVTNGHLVREYGVKLQAVGARGAEAQAQMKAKIHQMRALRLRAEIEGPGAAKFLKLTGTMQQQIVDGEISKELAAMEYLTMLNKRLSYTMEFVRSVLSYCKEEFRVQQGIPQR